MRGRLVNRRDEPFCKGSGDLSLIPGFSTVLSHWILQEPKAIHLHSCSVPEHCIPGLGVQQKTCFPNPAVTAAWYFNIKTLQQAHPPGQGPVPQNHSVCWTQWPAEGVEQMAIPSPVRCISAGSPVGPTAARPGPSLHAGSREDNKSHPCFSASPPIQVTTKLSNKNTAKDKGDDIQCYQVIIRYYGSHVPILLTNTGFLLICSTIDLCATKIVCVQ